MRKLKRLDLDVKTRFFLEKRRKKVEGKSSFPEQKKEASRLWNLKKNKAFAKIRETLRKMAHGIERCMYCEDSAGTDIEHFWPQADYPLKAFLWENYLLACSSCNSNNKRFQFPMDSSNQPLLINPVEEEPRSHISFSPSTGKYFHRSTKGKESIRVYGLNRDILSEGRKDAWIGLQGIIVAYGAMLDKSNIKRAEKFKRTICRYPFSGVFIDLLSRIDKPGAKNVISQECIDTIEKYPEIKDWLLI